MAVAQLAVTWSWPAPFCWGCQTSSTELWLAADRPGKQVTYSIAIGCQLAVKDWPPPRTSVQGCSTSACCTVVPTWAG